MRFIGIRSILPTSLAAVLALGISLSAQAADPASAKSAAGQGKKPNIVIIMTDDVGWGDLGCYGGGVTRGAPTPHLDRLAAEGALFTTWYGQASCTAGRASFITGRIPIRSALSAVIAPGDPNHIHAETPTIAEFFQKNGYRTYYSGKWHLGDKPEDFPINHGFDEMKHFLAYYAGVYAYPDPELHPNFPRWNPQFMAMYNSMVNDGEWEGVAGKPAKRVIEHFGYADLATIDNRQRDSAIAYLKAHAKDDKPFFMYVAFLKLHQPNNPAPEFKGKSRQSNYLDSLMELDSNSGQIIQTIRDLGLEKDTILVWTTDNGPWIDAWPDAGYTPFRGMKGSGFEGGWRVPGIMWAPGRIKAGSVYHGMMSHMDVWPTLATMAGLTPPPHGEWKDDNGKPIYFDGYDNSAYITGEAEESARMSWVYIDAVSFLGVRFGEWKFLYTAKDTWLGPELHLSIPAIYNLKQDPAEHYDMTFNGAAPATAGVLKSSPGRYSGADNGWAGVFSTIPLNEFLESIKKFPNIPTVPAGASMGADLPVFVPPNLAPGNDR